MYNIKTHSSTTQLQYDYDFRAMNPKLIVSFHENKIYLINCDVPERIKFVNWNPTSIFEVFPSSSYAVMAMSGYKE